ncbi:MAG TPA: Na/Pi cotransporter family protein, partial [Thiothrix sp.]|nr:Na/Pi cotransporter family protein [Thiothrix sp.]
MLPLRVLSAFLLLFFSSSSFAAMGIRATDQSTFELGAIVLGGIGLFLIGIHFAGTHLRQMTDSLFNRFLNRLTQSWLGLFSGGVLLGFFTQSGKAVAFIVADFVQAGMMKTHQAAFIVFFGNAGASLIAFVSVLNIKVFALILLGITGLGLTFHIPKRFVSAYGALFGLGMIMLGLYLVKDGASGFAGLDWMASIIYGMHDFYLISFLLGFALTLILQSNIAANLIIMAFAATGFLFVPEGFMAILGAQASTGLMTYIYSFHAKGRARQVVIQQIAFDSIVTVFFLLIFFIEQGLNIPLFMLWIKAWFESEGEQMLVLVISTQFIGAVLLVLLHQPISRLIAHYFKPTSVEILAATAFINEQDHRLVRAAETHLLLIEKEQMRLMQRLPHYIEYVRQQHHQQDQPIAQKQHTPKAFHEAYQLIAEQIAKTLSKISANQLSDIEANKLMTRTKLQEQLNRLEGIVFNFTEMMQHDELNPQAIILGEHIMESLDFMIMTAIDALESNDDDEIHTLSLLTQDRSQMMMKLRDGYFHSEHDFTQADRNFILDVTILLEH